MDNMTVIILVTLVAFFGLAALLLVPIWRFLDREEEVSQQWTRNKVNERRRERRRQRIREGQSEGDEAGETQRDGEPDG